MSEVITARVCTKCRRDKPLEQFSRAPRGKYGRKPSCKECDAARHAATFVPKPPRSEEAERARYTRSKSGPKLCPMCGLAKERSEFHKQKDGVYGPILQTYCKPCLYLEKRKAALVRAYGLTVADYEAMLAAQGGVCATCKQPERAQRKGKTMLMPVDHDHRTGQVRGILCHACNRAIGLLGDQPDRIRAAIRYLHSKV